VHNYERSNLEERHKVALRLVDAFILEFGQVSPALAAAARHYFSDDEILDIVMKVFQSSTNKIRVSLRIDDPENAESEFGIRTLEYPVAPNFVPGSSKPG
jgi:hypothetical protein